MNTVRILNGYRVIYRPDSPSAMTSQNWNGWVYEHIYVAEKYYGRRLRDDEVVHHLDGHRDNNHHGNLLILSYTSHGKLHSWIDSGIPFGVRTHVNEFCEICGITLQTDQSKFCSAEHADIGRRKADDRPSEQQLLQLIKYNSYVSIGKMYGVSDNAVRKWVIGYGHDPKTIRKMLK